MNLVNLAVSEFILNRDRPNADPQAVLGYSLLASLTPGNLGLLLPFLVEQGTLAQDSAPQNSAASDTKNAANNSASSSSTGGDTTGGAGAADSTDTTDGGLQGQIDTVNRKLDDVLKRLQALSASTPTPVLTPTPAGTPATAPTGNTPGGKS